MSKRENKKRKQNKQRKSKLKQNIPMVLMTVGIFFMALSGLHWILKFRALSLDKKLLAQYSSQEISSQINSIPIKIYLQWRLDTAITEQVLVDGNWTISETEASHLANSANPGEDGNIIIYGHNKRSILGNLRALKGGEIITITTADGGEHKYQVSKIAEVNPDQTSYLEPTTEETLTLYTCSGLMDAKRFIVQAKPI